MASLRADAMPLSKAIGQGYAPGHEQACANLATAPATRRRDDHDSPWKDALEVFLPQAIAMFAPTLHAHGYRRDSVVNLLRFIDWILALPPEMENTYIDAVEQIEKERAMAYVTSYERIYKQRGMEAGMALGKELGKEIGKEIGLVQGERQGIMTTLQDLIEARFGILSDQDKQVLQQADTTQLRQWVKHILTADSLQALFAQSS